MVVVPSFNEFTNWFMDVRACQIAVNHDMVHKITLNGDIYRQSWILTHVVPSDCSSSLGLIALRLLSSY